MSDRIDVFKDFLVEHTDLMEKVHESTLLDIDDIRTFDRDLAAEILTNPLQFVPVIDSVLREHAKCQTRAAFTGTFGDHLVTPRTIGAAQLGHMVQVEGIVVSMSRVSPKLVRSVHYSPSGGYFLEREYRDALTVSNQPPTSTSYPTSDANGPLQTEFGLSHFEDFQSFILQEDIEEAPPGQLPRSIEIVGIPNLVKAGDRVRVTGIFKGISNYRQGARPRIRSVIIANHVEVRSAIVINVGFVPFAVEEVFAAIAPNIFGCEDVKRGVALMMVGGNEIVLENSSRVRGDINVLIVGDPGVGKSQILRFVHSLSGCVQTSGKGSSMVGLTASVIDGAIVAGAAVLADRGILTIDEFDKIDEEDQLALHEAMEQQTISISKAGINTVLNARCAVLAAANFRRMRKVPIGFKNSNEESAVSRSILAEAKKKKERKELKGLFGIPESLLSRFDMIFIIEDKRDSDDALCDAVFNNHINLQPKRNGKLWAYLQSCKQLRPKLTEGAREVIVKEFVNMRKKRYFVKITPRALESLIRISTAFAKIRRSEIVEEVDANNAASLLRGTLEYSFDKTVEIDTNYNCDAELKRQKIQTSEGDADRISGMLYSFRKNHPETSTVHINTFMKEAGLGDECSVRETLYEMSENGIILFLDDLISFID